MTIFNWILIGLWLIFISYWLVSSLGTKKTLGQKSSVRGAWSRLATILITLIIINIPGFDQFSRSLQQTLFTPLLGIVGVTLATLGIGLAIWARAYLGKNWGMPRSIKAEPELITTGPYHFVRHPIYTGVLLAMFGSALIAGIAWLVIIIAFSYYFISSAKVEEELLTEQFPDQYPFYQKRTKILIPFIF